MSPRNEAHQRSARPHTSAYVRNRQHTSAYVSISTHRRSTRPHTPAIVSIRQHTYAPTKRAYKYIRVAASAYISIRRCVRQHTSAFVVCYVSTRTHRRSAHINIYESQQEAHLRPPTPPPTRVRRHRHIYSRTGVYPHIHTCRWLTYADVCCIYSRKGITERTSSSISEAIGRSHLIRQRTSAYVSIRQPSVAAT